jgi:hypothetical protein
MNRKYLMMAALAVGLAGPMAAHAQQAAPDQNMPDQTSPQQAAPQATSMPNSQDPSTAPQSYGNTPDSTVNPATQAGVPAAATVGSSDDNNAAAPAPASGLTTATDASGAQVISNGPIPDTRANRAKYGRPLSQAGRMTKAKGN